MRQRNLASTITVEEILHRWRKIERGPKPRLSEIQLFTALYFIAEHAPIGRYDLANQIHENQGVMRGLLERLQEHHLIESSKAGARATDEGRKVLAAFLSDHGIAELKRVEIPSLLSARHTYGLHLKREDRKPTKVIEQRDAAVRMGAQGAMVLQRTSRGFTIPPDNQSLNRLYPDAGAILEAEFPSKEGEIVLLSFSDDEYAALAGVLAASFSVAA